MNVGEESKPWGTWLMAEDAWKTNGGDSARGTRSERSPEKELSSEASISFHLEKENGETAKVFPKTLNEGAKEGNLLFKAALNEGRSRSFDGARRNWPEKIEQAGHNRNSNNRIKR